MNAVAANTTVKWEDGRRRFTATFGRIVEVDGTQYQDFTCRYRQASKHGVQSEGFVNLSTGQLVEMNLRNGRIYGTFDPEYLNKALSLI